MPAFTINMPTALHKAIKGKAKDEFTSMASVCRKILATHVALEKKKPATK